MILLLLLACPGDASRDETCEAICDELVMTCAYEAYPTHDSCLQGCLYEEEQGSNMGRAWQCIQAAECDTFAIVECEHAVE
ncbi:MAG: hypothetical protein ACOZNI_32150 [Myxococcota bacterium]